MAMTQSQLRRWRQEHSVQNVDVPEEAPVQRGQPTGFQPGRAPVESIYTSPYGEEETPSAAEMGGAVETPGEDYTIEYGPDMRPRRVPRTLGPQSFGDLLQGTDAEGLVKMVRQDRLARQAVRTETFGEIAGKTRIAREEAENKLAEEEAQAAEFAANIKFLVNVRTGEYEPVMPDQDMPAPGPYQVVVSMGPSEEEPIFHAKGAKVTKKMLDDLGDYENLGIAPTLRPGYKVPEQYAEIAKALGVET